MHAPAFLITARLGAKDGSNTYQTVGSPESIVMRLENSCGCTCHVCMVYDPHKSYVVSVSLYLVLFRQEVLRWEEYNKHDQHQANRSELRMGFKVCLQSAVSMTTSTSTVLTTAMHWACQGLDQCRFCLRIT